jgi:hypothetical protein
MLQLQTSNQSPRIHQLGMSAIVIPLAPGAPLFDSVRNFRFSHWGQGIYRPSYRKSQGNYVIPAEELPKLDRLYARYGIASEEPETPPEADPFASG